MTKDSTANLGVSGGSTRKHNSIIFGKLEMTKDSTTNPRVFGRSTRKYSLRPKKMMFCDLKFILEKTMF